MGILSCQIYGTKCPNNSDIKKISHDTCKGCEYATYVGGTFSECRLDTSSVKKEKTITKEEIVHTPEFKAANIAFQNGLTRCYDLQEMAHYMFLQGIKFGKTGEMPELEK